MSPFAICASAKDDFEMFVSDIHLNKVLSISNVVEEETNYVGELQEFLSSWLPVLILGSC